VLHKIIGSDHVEIQEEQVLALLKQYYLCGHVTERLYMIQM